MTEQLMARHWIGGEWADSARTSYSVNPATGEVIGSYADADAGNGQVAIDAAARSFAASTWRLAAGFSWSVRSLTRLPRHWRDGWKRASRPGLRPGQRDRSLIDLASVTRVDAVVEAAIVAGAKVIVRGGPRTDPALADGAFYHPALLAVTDSELPIVQQETFGPVQTVQVFDTEEEAITLANDLSVCIWSRDADRPVRVAHQLDEEGWFKSSGIGGWAASPASKTSWSTGRSRRTTCHWAGNAASRPGAGRAASRSRLVEVISS